MTALGQKIVAPRRKEKPVAIIDDVLQRVAGGVGRQNLGRRLARLEQRLVELVERERVVEERGVNDRARDGDLVRDHPLTALPMAPSAATTGVCAVASAIRQPV